MKKAMAIVLLAFLVVTFLMATAQKVEDFIFPVFLGKIDEVKRLIKAGVDVNEKFSWGASRDITALVLAVNFGRTEIYNILIDAGADVNIKTTGLMTLLHHVAISEGDYKDITELLIAKGLDVNAKTTVIDLTPLHAAAGIGNINVAEVLIKNGADLEAKAHDVHYTPLHVAARNDKKAAAELLIAKGADVNAKTLLDETPLDLAIAKKYEGLVDLLRKHGGKSGRDK
jgi:ankyrin repeat protein